MGHVYWKLNNGLFLRSLESKQEPPSDKAGIDEVVFEQSVANCLTVFPYNAGIDFEKYIESFLERIDAFSSE